MNNISRGNVESNLEFLDAVKVLDKQKSILEIGSGSGYLVEKLIEKGYKIIGTEINDDYIEFAKDNFKIDLVKIDGTNLNFADNSFDVVLSFDVFEHIPDSDRHLEEVKRVLKPGGYYLFQTPNKWINIIYEIANKKKLFEYKKYHCSLHSYRDLKKRLKKHGFGFDFVEVKVVNQYFKGKIKNTFGVFGLLFLRFFDPDKMPLFLRTNFYVKSRPKK